MESDLAGALSRNRAAIIGGTKDDWGGCGSTAAERVADGGCDLANSAYARTVADTTTVYSSLAAELSE